MTNIFFTTLIGLGYKVCESDGEWFKHPETNKSWSNYTTCVNVEDLEVSVLYNKSFFLLQNVLNLLKSYLVERSI